MSGEGWNTLIECSQPRTDINTFFCDLLNFALTVLKYQKIMEDWGDDFPFSMVVPQIFFCGDHKFIYIREIKSCQEEIWIFNMRESPWSKSEKGLK